MKQTIVPVSVGYKPTKAGVVRYEVEDSDRYIYSVWDEEIAKKLKIGVACDVEVQDSKDGKYKTIREFYASGPGAVARSEQRAETEIRATPGTPVHGFQKQDVKPERVRPATKPEWQKGNEIQAGILVSYAKDMWVAAEGKQALKQYLEPVIEAYKLALEKL